MSEIPLDSQPGLPAYFFPNMLELSERVVVNLKETREKPVISMDKPSNTEVRQQEFSKDAERIIPFTLSLKWELINNRDRCGIAQVLAKGVNPVFLRKILEDIYGTELSQTGIYVVAGLDKTEGQVELSNLTLYFPEVEHISNLNNRHIIISNNPFLTILTLPIETRAFFTGALLEKQLTQEEDALSNHFQKPLNLRDIMAYAKKVDEIEKVKQYAKYYNPK